MYPLLRKPVFSLFLPVLFLGMASNAVAWPFSSQTNNPPVQTAQSPNFPTQPAQTQASVMRIQELETEIRQLTGRVEELNFQVLTMQEDLRRVSEFLKQHYPDNNLSLVSNSAPLSQDQAVQNQTTQPEMNWNTQSLGDQASAAQSETGSGQDGVHSATPSAQDDMQRIEAEIAANDSPQALYDMGYKYVLSGQYAISEHVFRSFIEKYPDNELSEDALFWLAESLFGQQKYKEAGEQYLAFNKQYPQSQRAAENLLKLGMTMQRLGNRDVVCDIYSRVETLYPEAASATQKLLISEKQRANCS